MPFSDKGSSDDVEALVDTFTIASSSTIASLSNNDYQKLAELSQELRLTTEMETEESGVILETVENAEVEEEVIHEDIGAQEIEIETEDRAPTPEEILPDIKSTKITTAATVPPLRPLTIAPKPAKIAMKPMPTQQLLLLQGTSSNQQIKLVSTQGQELNLANFPIGRPVAIKPAGKTQLVPSKMVMKKIVPSQKGNQPIITNQKNQIVVVQKGNEQVKLLPNTTKTITLQQAQEMGLLPATTKILPQAQSTPKKTLMVNKGQTMKTIKIVPQLTQAQLVTTANQKTISTIKSPVKILPATVTPTGSKVPQRIIFKNTGTTQNILPQAQLIHVTGTQALSTGQIHQINIPGKGPQLIKFVTATTAETVPTSTVKTNVSGTTITQPTSIILSEVKPNNSGVSSITPKPLKSLASKSTSTTTTAATTTTTTNQQVVVIPNYIQQKVAIPSMRHTTQKLTTESSIKPSVIEPNLESNGIRPRKPCNCTKSQCLKLYCDCFANGEFCYMCNCMNCFNNLENEDHRQRAIKACLERNPTAFRPKIGKAKDMTGDSSIRKHTKGCNCKRSGCLKNYCECYEAKIACSNNCKCVGCRNIEDSMDKKSLRSSLDEPLSVTQPQLHKLPKDITTFRSRRNSNTKQAINFITDDVIEATTQCMLTISDSGESNMQDEELTKSQIIEEFGRCLTEIINCSAPQN